ncbi:MAG: Imm61 family immunity protein [Mycobacterium sp.]|nr:Imm61 family immunity protein [Mycobacterium sp.]
MAVPALSPDCLGWVRAAGYAWCTDDSTGALVLRSQMDPPTRYYIRQVRDRLRLTQADDDAEERTLLFAADREVLERFLYGMFGDDIRDDLGLPFLELPWGAADLAAGYTLGEMDRGYRTLRRDDVPLAAAPDPTLSLLALVPLSHFLGFPAAALKTSFLAEDGAPLLTGGAYSAGTRADRAPAAGRTD